MVKKNVKGYGKIFSGGHNRKIIDSTTQYRSKDISDNLIPDVNLHINSTIINGSPDKANTHLQK
jgi:hypothetical protein